MNPAPQIPASNGVTVQYFPNFASSREELVCQELQQAPIPTSRTIVVVDTPNIFKSTREACGNDCVPDYSELLAMARARGDLVASFALVNDGYPRYLWTALERTGYAVLQSEGRDCDYRFVEQTVAVYREADIFILCSGDHRFSALASLLRDLGKQVIISSVRSCCSRRLIANANEFMPFPVRQKKTSRLRKHRSRARSHQVLRKSSIEAGLIVPKDMCNKYFPDEP